MFIDDHHYDCIIVGSGAGGATLAGELTRKGKWVLLLERGGQLPLEELNIKGVELFKKTRYHPQDEVWFGPDGDPFSPQAAYALGGNTKIWGAVLQRMRQEDFKETKLLEGVSPSWPFEYEELESYYEKAERMYKVHGKTGVDITEPPRNSDYEFKPRSVEPFMNSLRKSLEANNCSPYDLPISWADNSLVENEKFPSCSFFSHGDAQLFGIYESDRTRLELRTNAQVSRLHINPNGNAVKAVEVDIQGDKWLFSADIVVLSAGAINTPTILLNSKNQKYINGLANNSDQVGRNLMNLQMTCILQRATQDINGLFRKSLGVNDYYRGDKNVNYPLGHIQTGGGVLQDVLFAESPPVLSLISKLIPDFGLKRLASRSISWWAMTEVLPNPENRIIIKDNKIHINYVHNNLEAHDRLVYRWLDTLKKIEKNQTGKIISRSPTFPRGASPLSVVGYACGTCKMGIDPKYSVVNKDGKCHDLDNLFICDASVFPSCPSIGGGLTVIALALKMADTLTSNKILRPLICRPN